MLVAATCAGPLLLEHFLLPSSPIPPASLRQRLTPPPTYNSAHTPKGTNPWSNLARFRSAGGALLMQWLAGLCVSLRWWLVQSDGSPLLPELCPISPTFLPLTLFLSSHWLPHMTWMRDQCISLKLYSSLRKDAVQCDTGPEIGQISTGAAGASVQSFTEAQGTALENDNSAREASRWFNFNTSYPGPGPESFFHCQWQVNTGALRLSLL